MRFRWRGHAESPRPGAAELPGARARCCRSTAMPGFLPRLGHRGRSSRLDSSTSRGHTHTRANNTCRQQARPTTALRTIHLCASTRQDGRFRPRARYPSARGRASGTSCRCHDIPSCILDRLRWVATRRRFRNLQATPTPSLPANVVSPRARQTSVVPPPRYPA